VIIGYRKYPFVTKPVKEKYRIKEKTKKILYQPIYYGRLIYYHLLKYLTHMVTVYIVINNIFIKLSGILCYLRWRPFFLKFIYIKIVKDLLYNLIVFNKSNYFHLTFANWTQQGIDFIYLLY